VLPHGTERAADWRGRMEEGLSQRRELGSRSGGALPVLMRWRRILRTSAGSMMTAMSFISQPHRGQTRGSTWYTFAISRGRPAWTMPIGRRAGAGSAPWWGCCRPVAAGHASLSIPVEQRVRHEAGGATAPCIGRSTSRSNERSERPRAGLSSSASQPAAARGMNCVRAAMKSVAFQSVVFCLK
jgi:hypothetical protein